MRMWALRNKETKEFWDDGIFSSEEDAEYNLSCIPTYAGEYEVAELIWKDEEDK